MLRQVNSEALNTAQAYVLDTFRGRLNSWKLQSVVRVVDFWLGRLQNTAPVHESELIKVVDFFFGLESALGGFLRVEWRPCRWASR